MNSVTEKRIIVSVTSDLVSDNRVHKVCNTLFKMGFSVILAGRQLPGSRPCIRTQYKILRFNLPFRRGFLFYASYNFRLFWFLIFSEFDLLLSNDLDTLPANYLASLIKRKPLVYDSHEYFTEVPELLGRPFVKRFWEILEQFLVPRLKYAYTVCDSIAQIYFEKYGVRFSVVRNFPEATGYNRYETAGIPDLPDMILYQGALNVGRGLEQAVMAMKYVDDGELVIAGDGDIEDKLKNLVSREGLEGKVKFAGRLPIEELVRITPRASVGISIEEDLGLSYHFALPNKLFDYIQAHVPVIVSDLPEMASIVRQYDIGEVTGSLDPEILGQLFNSLLNDRERRDKYKVNLKKAAGELTWENEEKTLKEIFKIFI